jgi:hypothetical protein
MSPILADQYSALMYGPKCEGGGGAGPMSKAVHMEPKLKFGDLTPYLVSHTVYLAGDNKITRAFSC